MSLFTRLDHPSLAQNASIVFASPYGYSLDALTRHVMDVFQRALESMHFEHDFFSQADHGFEHPEFDHPTDNPVAPSSQGGRRFGALIVRHHNGGIGFIKSFQHSLAGKWNHPDFVPSLISDAHRQKAYDNYFQALNECLHLNNNAEISATLQKQQHERKQLNQAFAKEIESLNLNAQANSPNALKNTHPSDDSLTHRQKSIKSQHRQLRQDWQSKVEVIDRKIDALMQDNQHIQSQLKLIYQKINHQLLTQCTLSNQDESATVWSLIDEQNESFDYFQDGVDAPLPKLLNYAFSHQLKPLTFVEFWWGKSPDSKIFHHKQAYPVSRRCCKPLLDFQLKKTPLKDSTKIAHAFSSSASLNIIYEDDDILAINKSAGVLSVPGVNTKDSIYQTVLASREDMSGPIIVHRLDLATSGILLLAKHKAAHQHLQSQFIERTIKKRYSAVLSRPIADINQTNGDHRIDYDQLRSINLPLIVDYKDRPRQMICHRKGKEAITHWCYQSEQDVDKSHPKVWLFPQTGRTHQLRVHCAYSNGLNAPILGDNLYGFHDHPRLMLHAESITFQPMHQSECITIHCSDFF